MESPGRNQSIMRMARFRRESGPTPQGKRAIGPLSVNSCAVGTYTGVDLSNVFLDKKKVGQLTGWSERTVKRWMASKSTVESRMVKVRGGYKKEVRASALPEFAKAALALESAKENHPETAARISGLATLQASARPASPVETPLPAGDASSASPSFAMPPAGYELPAVGLFSAGIEEIKDSNNHATPPQETQRAAREQWIGRQNERARQQADRRLKLLTTAINLSATMSLSRAFDLVGAENGVHRTTLNNWWNRIRRFPREDWWALLASIRAGGPDGAEISPDAWELLKADYLRLEKPTFKACFTRLRATAAANGWTLPSDATMRRRLQAIDPATRTYKRHGETALRQAYPAQERSVREMGAMEAINGDGYSHNVFVRWPDATAPDGFFVHRPKTWFWQDIYSRKIIGYRTDLSEHTELIRLSFLDVCDNFGVPGSIYIDNTRAAANKYLTGGVRHRFRFKLKENEPQGVWLRLGIPFVFVTPEWGQAKPIERSFGIGGMGEYVDKHPLLAGAFTGINTTDKPDYADKDARRRAVPLDIFIRALDEGVRLWNAIPGRRTEICNRVLSFDNAFAASYSQVPVRKLTAEQRQTLLLCGEGVTIQHDGTFKLKAGWGRGIGENRYFGDALRGFAGQKLTVFFDPQRLHSPVYAYAVDGRPICECELLEAQGFADIDAAKEHAHARGHWVKAQKELARAQVRLDAAAVAAAMPAPPELLKPEAKVVRVEFQRAAGGGGDDVVMPVTQGPQRRVLELAMLERMAETGGGEQTQLAPQPSYMDAVLATLDEDERRSDE